MTGYKKRTLNANGKSEWFVYESFGKAGGLQAVKTYNCDCRLGIKPALLYQPFCFLGTGSSTRGVMLKRDNAKRLYYFRYASGEAQTENEALFFFGDNKIFYQYTPADEGVSVKLSLGDDVAGAMLFNRKGEYGALFVGNKLAWHNHGAETPVAMDPVAAICTCKGRAFIGAQGGRILFSEPDDPWSFDTKEGNSYIDLTAAYGEITNFVVWNEVLYAFLEYGIFRLTPSGNMAESNLERIAYSGGKIFCASAGVCGKRIYFLADDGVYSFDGKTAEKVCKHLPVYPLKVGQFCSFAAQGDRALLCYQDEAKGNTTLVIFDETVPTACFADGFKSIGGDGARTIFSVLESNFDWLKILSPHGSVYGESCFKSGRLTFGKEGRKTLKRLRFYGRGEVLCRIYNGNRVVERTVAMGDDEKTSVKIDVFERGEGFYLEFVFTEEAEISSVAAEVAFVR